MRVIRCTSASGDPQLQSVVGCTVKMASHVWVKLSFRLVWSTLISIAVSGCLWPPATKVTTPLASAPTTRYTAVIVHPILDSTSADVAPSFYQRIMAETVTRLMKSRTFEYWHLEDTAILSQPTFFEFKRDKLLSLDSLRQVSRDIVELSITLTEFDKGDKLTRVLLGYVAGGGAVAVRTRLTDNRYGHVVVAGDTRRTIRGAHAGDYSTVRPLARGVTLFLDGNMRTLAKRVTQ